MSLIEAEKLFSVKGLVAVITGGATGKSSTQMEEIMRMTFPRNWIHDG